VRDALGLAEVVILGQSWGGMLLLEYVCRHPHPGVKGIVLSSTLPSAKLWALEQARMLRQLPEELQAIIRQAVDSGISPRRTIVRRRNIL
ncbi:MAG: alpha/beta fold hydrolase, partial [Clostridia bacterium]|nr:alpha/beta fold hydrolase [Clostridia bacterium]